MQLNALLIEVRSNGIQFVPYDIERGRIYGYHQSFEIPVTGGVVVYVSHAACQMKDVLDLVITVESVNEPVHSKTQFLADLNDGNIIKLPHGAITSDMVVHQYPGHLSRIDSEDAVTKLLVIENDLVMNDVRGALLVAMPEDGSIPSYEDAIDSLNQTTIYRLASQFEICLSDKLDKMLPKDHTLKDTVTVITERWDDEYLITFSNSLLVNSPEYRFHVKYDRENNQPTVKLIDNREYYGLNVSRWQSKMEVDVSYFNHFDASRTSILALEKLGVFLINVSAMDETWECHLLNKQAIAGLDDVVQSIIGGELLHREHAIELLSNERFGKLFPFLSTSMSLD